MSVKGFVIEIDSMLKQIIDAARLRPESCASLLRVPVGDFRAWMDGKRPIPRYVIPELSSILGVSERDLFAKPTSGEQDSALLAPAVWFKLRHDKLTDADRDFVGLVRQLGFFMAQLSAIKNTRQLVRWRAASRSVLESVDRTASPVSQGREAAMRFREALDLNQGQTGIGELIRPRLRQYGLMVIESPIPRSALEGCCFAFGRDEGTVPCVFANTFRSTWFRRNEIILHEVCHALFDIENDPVALDFKDDVGSIDQFVESRSRAFAQHCLVPEKVLVHYGNQFGIKWNSLSAEELAQLIAAIHAEQRTILRSAVDYGLINAAQAYEYENLDCAEPLRKRSKHALTTHEYIKAHESNDEPKWLSKNRTTTLGPRPLTLPAGYVQQVIDALNENQISIGKAAEMLMVDEVTFLDRYEDLISMVEVL